MEYRFRREEKPVVWIGASLEEIRAFPDAARREAGQQLHRVQQGVMPGAWKPAPSVGPGAFEIRVRTEHHGATLQHRVLVVAKFEEAVYVLHSFEKHSRKMPRHDIAIARSRYAEVLRVRRGSHGE